MGKLGPEPFSDDFAAMMLEGSDPGRVHAMLRDQRRVAGIGRGYSDDILHRAKLSPFRSLTALSQEERLRLLDSVRSVLTEGLDVERTRQGGLPPKLGDHWIVHGRAGTPCPVCGSDLRRVSYESHEVTYCPTCQTGGRILADRRLSRLLK
jgi:formamidopyrimidine-DNA glycosylase